VVLLRKEAMMNQRNQEEGLRGLAKAVGKGKKKNRKSKIPLAIKISIIIGALILLALIVLDRIG
jgi:t-SNARE complex subunit (syntaxin)|tara:strand:- start:185 stop:376 length:192 start_codon:yes stop_codon:yes gene_type:complete